MLIKNSLYRGFLAFALSLHASNATSENISFDYVQAIYISDTVDLGGSVDDVEGDGIGFSLSLSFAPAFAMTLAVTATTLRTFQSIDVISSKTTSLGVTAHTSVDSGTDIFANVSAVKAETTVNVGTDEINDNDFGAIINIGVRHQAADELEVELAASHMNVFGYTVNSYTIAARLFIREQFSVGVGYTGSDDVDSLFINARFNI